MESPPRRGTGAVLVAALVVLAAAAVFTAAGAAQADSADGERIHVDDDWRDANESETVEGGYVLGENATASIQAAVDLAGDGDTVVVHDGTYDPVRVTDHAVHLEAADGTTPEIAGDGAALVQFEGSTDGSSVEGFALAGDATLGVEVRANDVTVADNDISVGTTGVQVQDDADGSGAANGTLVTENTITGGVAGVSVNGGDTVTENTVEDASQEGIGVAGDDNDLAGNDALVPDGDAPAVQFYGDYDEVAEANALLADDAVHEVAFHDSDRVYDGAVVTNDTVYATIQQAVDAADDGDTVTITEDGIYAGFVVSEQVTVTAADGVDATIDADAGIATTQGVVDVRDASGDGDGATLSDLTVDATGQSEYVTGVSISADDVTVRKVTVVGDAEVTGIQTHSGYDGPGTEGTLLTENTVEGANVGISLISGNDTATNNTIVDARTEGFGLDGANYDLADNDVTTTGDAPAMQIHGAVDAPRAAANDFLAANPEAADVVVRSTGADYARDVTIEDTYYANVSAAVDAAESGDTVSLTAGTFAVADGERVTIDTDGVTLAGAGEEATTIEAGAQWGVYVSGTENVTLSEFTVDGVDDGWGSATVKADYSETLTIRNVTAESGYIGFDLNDVRDSTLRDVTVTGHSALGVSLKGVADVTADGLTTVGSPWGGVGIYNGPGSNGGPADWENVDVSDDVTIRDHTSEDEPVPVYTQAAEAGDVGDVRLQDATHVVENPNHKADGSDYFALYQYSQSAAVEYAANDSIHADASTSTVQPVETRDGSTEPTETYVVSPAMDAHVALDQAGEDATVLLLDGTHELGAGLDVETDGVTVRGESRSGTTLDASAVPGRAIETPSSGEVSDLTVTDLTVVGPQQGNDGNYALKFQPTTEDVTVRNVLVEESDETGIDFNGVEGVTVADTTVENTSANGVALTDTRNVTIRNATLTGNDWGGLALYTSSYAAEQGTYNVTVSDSTVTDTGSGIYAQNSGEVDEPFGDVTIRDTTFADNDAHVAGVGDGDLAWFDYEAALAANDFDRAVTVRADDGSIAAPVVATSVQTGVEAADAGETVALEPGTYPTNATLSKSLTLTGSGADASEQARLVPESGDQDRILTLNASDVTVEDLAFDGEETSVTAVGFWSEGEYASGATIRENSFDAVDYGVFLYPEGGEVSTGTVVAENTFTNVDQRAVLLYNNAYASVVDNDMTDVRIGVQTGNHWQGAGDAEPVIAGNDVDARDLGVFHNLQYQNAANWTVADNELSGGEGVLLTSISGDRTATVTNNTITDVETGLTAWNLDATAGVVVSDLTVENATTAVNVTDVEQYGTESVALSLRGLTVTDAETGVLATDANATAGGVAVGLFESTVEADTGLRVTGDADVTAEYVDFAGSGLAVNETGTAAVDADLNHFGDDPASAVAGNVTYDPFLTAPPSETSGDAGTLQQFGHDFAVPGDGQPRAVGFPGDVNATLGEVFGEFDGAVYRWNATAGEWVVPDAGTPVDALDAVVVVAEERATYTVDYADASPPGAPGQTDLDAGWNFVAAPLSGPVETAFGATSGGDVVRVVSAIPGPESQPYGLNASTFGTYTPSDSGIAVAGGGPTVSPFTGYWVYASDDGGLAGATYPGITLADEIAALDADGGQTTDQGES